MAYSNWGAYIWKNGEDITKQTADKRFSYNKEQNEWIEDNLLEAWCKTDDELDKTPNVGGHAVLVFENFALEFYKIYSPKIVFNTGKIIQTQFLEKDELIYKNKKLQLKITGMTINTNESIVKFDIEYKNDVYCVIVGMSIGNGYDKTRTSKFIRKHIVFFPERRSYFLEHRWTEATDTWQVLDYLGRLDDIKDEKYYRWEFGIKPFLKNLIQFKFKSAIYYLEEIRERNIKIKLLK